jgi:hypothetical protein
MTRKNRKMLVIDANIARSAGTTEVPSSFYSRACLDAVLKAEYVAVFSHALEQEWNKHASLYSRQWRASMVARRRIESVEGREFAHLLDRACSCLARIAWQDALRKDFHLVQSALATGQILLSNETNLPSHLKASCEAVTEFRKLFFANPEIEQGDCITWIVAGAKKETKRRIDQWSRHNAAN